MTAGELASESTRKTGLGLAHGTAGIIIAFNLAIAEPILNILGQGSEFFVAHDSSTFEILGIALLFTVAIPLGIAAIVAMTRLLGRRTWSITTLTILSILIAIWAMLFVKGLFADLHASVQLAIALAFGVIVTLIASRWKHTRDAIVWLMFIPIVILAVFVFASPSSKLIFQFDKAASATYAPDAANAIGNPVPIFILVLDELPVASLMTPEGTIDSTNFPNFAHLADKSTWYRNASTLDDHTNLAVPAMLDGVAPSKSMLPIAADHPNNLFELLSVEYRISAIEPITRICVTETCTDVSRRHRSDERWRTLLMDISVVIGHRVLPEPWTQRLPAVTETWGNFRQPPRPAEVGQVYGADPKAKAITLDQIKANNRKAIEGDHVGDFEHFLTLIENPEVPLLLFNHMMLPHRPWHYLPSGQRYPFLSHPGRVKGRWGDNEWLLRQAYQRHMLQLGLTDRLLGVFLTRLQRVGVFDKALIIVVADHGVAFELQAVERGVREDTVGAIAAIPLFIKYPGQSAPVVDDRPATTLDLVPTILDVLAVSGIQTNHEGESLRDSATERTKRYIEQNGGWLSVPIDGLDKYQIIDRKYELLGVDGEIDIFATTPRGFEGLVGRNLSDLTVTGPGKSTTTLREDIDFYRRVELDQLLFPGLIDGLLKRKNINDPVILAVAVNGHVSAVTETFMALRPGRWHAMLPPDSFQEGTNLIEIFELESIDGKFILRPVGIVED